MKIFICCSKAFYPKVTSIKKELESVGHAVMLPNSFTNPGREAEMHKIGAKEHSKWKAGMLRRQETKIKANDAIVVLNFEKNGQPGYIGGATFLEMFKAFETGKKIFLYNPIPDGILKDEILAFEPVLIRQDVSLVK